MSFGRSNSVWESQIRVVDNITGCDCRTQNQECHHSSNLDYQDVFLKLYNAQSYITISSLNSNVDAQGSYWSHSWASSLDGYIYQGPLPHSWLNSWTAADLPVWLVWTKVPPQLLLNAWHCNPFLCAENPSQFLHLVCRLWSVFACWSSVKTTCDIIEQYTHTVVLLTMKSPSKHSIYSECIHIRTLWNHWIFGDPTSFFLVQMQLAFLLLMRMNLRRISMSMPLPSPWVFGFGLFFPHILSSLAWLHLGLHRCHLQISVTLSVLLILQ